MRMERFRYRPGVVGESRRVVHASVLWSSSAGVVRSLCGREFALGDVEVLEGIGGMPCMACTRTAARQSRPSGSVIEGSHAVSALEVI